MNRKQQIIEAMKKQAISDVFLTDDEHAVLAKHGTTYRRYLEGGQPQTFVIKANTPEEKAEARELSQVLCKLDAITGNTDRINLITLEKHEGQNLN